jgi:hyperosmotically inducible protein
LRTHNIVVVPSLIALAVVLGLGACSQQIDDRSTGQKVDATIAKVEQKTDAAVATVEQKTDQAMASVKSGVNSAGTGTGTGIVVDTAKAKLSDAAITTSINAELARDPALSALKIDVDTSAGRVALHGTAPDASSRDRATVLAKGVDGVVGVDNLLEVRTN